VNIGEVGQLMTGFAATVAAINSLRNTRKIEAVHKATDGIVTRLVETTKVEAFAAGQKDEQDKAPQ
jgi:hypothetical protein